MRPHDWLEAAFNVFLRGVTPNTTRFLGGETIESLFARVLPAVEGLRADPEWQTALAVLHGGVNRAVLSWALTGERTFLGNIEQAPACINVLDLNARWMVRAVNFCPYDPVHLNNRSTTMQDLYAQYLAARDRERPSARRR